MIRFTLTTVLSIGLLGAAVVAPPSAPVINEPVAGALIHPADVHMEVFGYSDPEGQAHASSDWEILKTAAVVWQAPVVTGLDAVHIHLADGAFVGTYTGRTMMEFDTDYVLRCRFRDVAGETSAWSQRPFRTSSAGPPGQPGPNPWVPAPGFVVDVVAGGFQLPTNIAFIPNPGPNPTDPFFYVTELYGTIKVVFRNGTVGIFATGLLNFSPTGAFPGSGEQGLTGICVDGATGRVYVTLLYESAAAGNPHYPKIMRFTSADGGRTASSSTTILQMPGETQGQSHQISHISIGPDGMLYVHNGDGFEPGAALNLDSFRGKILRMNLDGSAPGDNPFYNSSNGITARDYVFAYGFRNPFGGAWRAFDGAHYEVENGPSVDRLAKVVAGRNFGFDGTDESMAAFASYAWSPARAPVNGAFVQPSTFAGSGFPGDRMDRLYITESGPTYAAGPQALGKRIVEFALTAAGAVSAGPSTVVEYNGIGHATAVALAAGPDGLYFSDLYKDQGAVAPADAGAQILRLRWIGLPPGGVTGNGLRAEVFDNINLTNLKVTRTDATVDFEWGTGPPDPSVAVDTFSVRWTGQIEATTTETVTFYTVSDDGVRLWINNQLLIDNWTDHAPTENAGAIALTAGQKYAVRMEMFENGVGAVARLLWSSPTIVKQIVPQARLFSPVLGSGVSAVYYDNMNFTGNAVTRTDATIDFNWALGPPHGSIGPQTFSVRWTGQVEAPATETFALHAIADDGVRLWVNNLLIIDKWFDQGATEWSATIPLVAGQKVDLRMDYYENGGDAVARLLWSSPSTPKQVIPSARLFPPVTSTQVASPAIMPNGGASSGPVSVSLASATSGASFRYTTDGTTPTSSIGTLYATPFTLTASATVRAIAYKAGMSDSAVASAVFTIVSPGAGTGLKGDYYDNVDFTMLRLSRTDATVNFNWDLASPDSSLGPETFSVRWTGEVEAPTSETYTFFVVSDDGIRLWVNNVLLVDNWTDHPPTENSGVIALIAGQRVAIRVDFYENAVGAMAALSWSTPSIARQIVPQARLFPAGPGTGVTAQYFDAMDFSALRVTRTDARIDFDWGTGSPDPSIGPDTFSVRWNGRVRPRYSQLFTFYTVSDDGVRLWVNGVLLVDNWSDHAPTENSGTIALNADQDYDFRMEFFENGGGAVARLLWSSASQAKEAISASRLFPPGSGAASMSASPLLTLNGGGDYDGIQEAIDAAKSGDVVELGALTYFVPGGLVLKAGVSLRGSSPLATILDGQGATAVIRVGGTPADGRSRIEGLMVTGGVTGIDAGAADVALRNVVVVRNSGDGVLGRQAGRVDAVHVTAAHNGGDGLRLLGDGAVRNTIASGNVGAGITGRAQATYTTLDPVEFENAAALDYREKAGTSAVDAGDPADPFHREPAPSGGRANLGAFGGTSDAAASGASESSKDPVCGTLGLEAFLAFALLAFRKRNR